MVLAAPSEAMPRAIRRVRELPGSPGRSRDEEEDGEDVGPGDLRKGEGAR